MHNPPTMDENNASYRPAFGSLLERQMHATDTATFNQSISSLDKSISSLDTIFESTAESARLCVDCGTAAHNSWDGVFCEYDRCRRHRNLKQDWREQGGSFSSDLAPIATTRQNKQRQRSPLARRGLAGIMRISLGADSHRPNTTASRITSGSTSSMSSNHQQDRWQSIVKSVVTSPATTRVPAFLVGTSPKKEGIKSVSLTVRSLPREKEMRKCEEGPPTIDKLLELKWEREQQESSWSR